MHQTLKKRLVSGGLWVLGGKIYSVFVQLAVNALLARLLLPSDVGLYFLIASLVEFFVIFSLLGMKRSIVRTISEALAKKQPTRASQAVRFAMQIGLLASVILALSLVSGAGQMVAEKVFGSPLMGNLIYLPAIWLVVLTLLTIIAESFRGYHDIRFATLFNRMVANTIIASILGFLAITNQAVDIRIILTFVVVAYAINLVVALLVIQGYLGKGTRPQRAGISRSELLQKSWVLYFNDIVLFLSFQGQLWLLSYYSVKEDVAIFGAVLRLMTLVTATLNMLRMTILPTIGDLYTKQQYREVEKVLRVSATIAGLPAIAGLLLIILFGKNILFIIFGSHYTAGYMALVVLAMANLINVFTGTPAVLMIMASKENYLLGFSLISGVLSILTSFLLVGRLSYLGVAIGAGVGIVLYNILMVYFCKKKLSILTILSVDGLKALASTFKERIPFSRT